MITVVPSDTPPTTPEIIPTVPTADVLLVQNPPAGELARVVVAPMHMLGDPVMGAGNGLTVTTELIVQPPTEYTIVEVPSVKPLTAPEVELTVATAGLLLVHVPPGVEFASVLVVPRHTTRLPVIGLSNGLTVTTLVVKQTPTV